MSNLMEKDRENRFVAVILAAGYSSRMKKFKPLLPIGDIPAIKRLIFSSRAAGVERVIVVTGNDRERLRDIIEETGVVEAYNERYESGMFSSIQEGLNTADEIFPDAAGYFLMPVDCPLISGDVIKSLVNNIKTEVSDRMFFVPVYEGKKGHPLFIPKYYSEEICSHGGERGLKAITDKYWDMMIRVAVNQEGCVLDMDTPEHYEEIVAFWEGGCRRRDLSKLVCGRRIFLVRHGETRQHDEKMFIGQYDVPLSDKGRQQVGETSDKIAGIIFEKPPYDKLYEAAIHNISIYSSDLDRAKESAHILSERLKIRAKRSITGQTTSFGGQLDFNGRVESEKVMECDVVLISDFREINLGEWDGKPIREIKSRFPEEYKRRGADIFKFKTGNKAENFYDMQYRAVAALRRILEEDDSRELIIVTHSGVIRALENNLKGFRVDDAWQGIDKGSFVVIDRRG